MVRRRRQTRRDPVALLTWRPRLRLLNLRLVYRALSCGQRTATPLPSVLLTLRAGGRRKAGELAKSVTAGSACLVDGSLRISEAGV